VLLQSLRYWTDIKQTTLIKDIVPFVPVTEEGVFSMLKYYLSPVGPLLSHHKLTQWNIVSNVGTETVAELANYLYMKSKTVLYQWKNYRGIDEIIGEEIQAPLFELLYEIDYESYLTLHLSLHLEINPDTGSKEIRVELSRFNNNVKDL